MYLQSLWVHLWVQHEVWIPWRHKKSQAPDSKATAFIQQEMLVAWAIMVNVEVVNSDWTLGMAHLECEIQRSFLPDYVRTEQLPSPARECVREGSLS